MPLSSLTPYSYETLPEKSHIRLLERQPKSPDGSLSFTLGAYAIADPDTKYHCLSYTWGNPYAHGVPFREHFAAVGPEYEAAHKVLILVNGHSLYIQRNLHDALATVPEKRPRNVEEDDADSGKLIWADAICINQGDVDEKSSQVGMMDLIYSKASFVVAWLGPHDQHSRDGLRILSVLSSHITQFKESKIDPYNGYDEDNYKAAGIPHISRQEWIALGSIFQRQWFRRAWIVQEAVLPSVLTMYIGDSLVSWHDLGVVSEALRRNQARLGTKTSNLFVPVNEVALAVEWNMAEIFKWRNSMKLASSQDPVVAGEHQALFILGELIGCFWTFGASEPKDRVFSLYGILNIFSKKRIMTDYRHSLARVYTAAARQIISDAGHMGIMSSCIYSKQRIESLPSWVPDFSLPGINPIPDIFSADKGLPYEAPIAVSPDNPTLKVCGYLVGSISEAAGRRGTGPGEKFLFDPSWLRMAATLRPPQAKKTGEAGAAGVSLSEILWRTLCMDMSAGTAFDAQAYGAQAPQEFSQQFRIFMLLMVLAGADEKILESKGIKPNVMSHDMLLGYKSYNPFDDMASTLDDLDRLEAHDSRDSLCTPTRQEIMMMWDNLKYSLVRNSDVNPAGGPMDFTVSPDAMQGKAWVVGNGFVCTNSMVFAACQGFAIAYATAYGGRQLITVDGRYLGLAPVSAMEGDEVWILPGLRAPAVLRRTKKPDLQEALGSLTLNQDPAPQYRFVGSSYVHGVMRGEFAQEIDHQQLRNIELV